jgi:hypothetical protein
MEKGSSLEDEHYRSEKSVPSNEKKFRETESILER